MPLVFIILNTKYTKMHFGKATLGLAFGATLAAGAAVAEQGLLYATNKCSENVYLVYSNEQYKEARKTLSTGQGFQIILSGKGYSVGFSTDPNFYSEAVPKLILGYSVNSDNGLIYYSIAPDYGNPFASQSFSLTSFNSQCPSVRSPDKVTYACAATSSFELTLCG